MAMASVQEPSFIVPSHLGEDGCFKNYAGRPMTVTSSFSRSTSAGSASASPPPSPPECVAAAMQMDVPECQNYSNKLPEFEYPVPFTIRNTFVDTGIGRPLSLDEFYEERKIKSCPVEPPPGLEDDDTPGARLHQAMTAGSVMLAARAAAAAAATSTMSWFVPAPPPTENLAVSNTFTANSGVQAAALPTLSLANALAEPEPQLGSPEMPTIGSAGHRYGACKPCAFFTTKGCGNGVDCVFCHLCPPGEKKRRQREKVATQRAAQQCQFW